MKLWKRNHMRLEKLRRDQIEMIYTQRMREDFPPNELKPLSMIYKAVDNGIYTCLGLMEEDAILGYAFLVKLKETEDYLIDYIATDKTKRNNGLGAIMLRELNAMLSNARSVIGEVENPAFEEDIAKKELQIRRYNFYMRNGLTDTGVWVTCFGVPFIVLELECEEKHTEEEIKSLYKQHYKALLPREMYEKNILVE